jgi:N-acetylglucosamine-6-phosphate deacetylase
LHNDLPLDDKNLNINFTIMQKNYLAAKIFTGDEWITNAVVTVENGLIKKISSGNDIAISDFIKIEEGFLVPAFIDLQIYGANKKLFAVYPTVDALQDLCDYCKQGGAVLFQPTVATNTLDVFHRCIDAVRQYWKEERQGLIGLHLEGPWLNPEKRGAHPKELIHSPTLKEVRELLEYGKDVITMITIAPEVCGKDVIEIIQSYGIVISAGHSNANYNEAIEALDNGIPTITHLYNAMSALQHRAPGLVGAAFTHSTAMASIIPDGHHVDYAAIKIAAQQMKERLFVITDAVTETNEGVYHHHFENDKYTSNGILSGSSLTVHKAFVNLVKEVNVSIEQAINMCSLYPARLMGLDKYGKIAPGYAAQFLLLDDDLNLKEVING